VPQRIGALTAGLEPARLRTAPDPEKWFANDVLAQLPACADMWGEAISTIIADDRPTIRAVNPRTWIKQTDYLELDFQPSFHAFTSQRADLLAVLKPLPLVGWSRSATVKGAGAVLERTVLTYADGLVRHEQPHLKQITRIVSGWRQSE
jgi:hypothetical protein